MNSKRSVTRSVTVGLVLTTLAIAIPHAHAEDEHPPPRPPRAAIEACKDKADGATCAFDVDGRSLSGTCFAPAGKPLACRPAGRPPR